tara:strand:- start:31620 stop:32156 length:537 start_codon:yes stop_codon:yes gene_type:complete
MGKFVNTPIKRHEALIPLSRDHFTGLAHAQRLMKSAPKDRVSRHKALAGFIDAWTIEISDHFDDEERLFHGVLSQTDEQRLLDEHQTIRALVNETKHLRASVDPCPDRIKHIGQTLNDHIRWEERELFGRIENSLDDEHLRIMAKETDRIEQSRARSNNGKKNDESELSPNSVHAKDM